MFSYFLSEKVEKNPFFFLSAKSGIKLGISNYYKQFVWRNKLTYMYKLKYASVFET